MDTDILRKKMVTLEQINNLLEFMKEHPNLAKGLNRGGRGKLMSTLKVWNACAKRLNTMQGAVKNGKAWSKYWCDWKYRVRRHALELKAAKDSNRPPPETLMALSPIEETIMSIIGETALDGMVIKNDPLADGELHEDVPDIDHDNEVPTSTRSKKRKLERNPSRESYSEDHDAASSPPDSKDRLEDIDLEDEDEATQFLNLEKEKLEQSRKFQESVQVIATELTRLTNVMVQIKDVLVSRFNT